jgi:predicted DNA-binding transcriptional regulator AlpA
LGWHSGYAQKNLLNAFFNPTITHVLTQVRTKTTLSKNVHISHLWIPYAYDVGRNVDVENLVGAYEIAQRLGVARPQVIHEWRRRHSEFPRPIAALKTALIWDWRDIDEWAKLTGRHKID